MQAGASVGLGKKGPNYTRERKRMDQPTQRKKLGKREKGKACRQGPAEERERGKKEKGGDDCASWATKLSRRVGHGIGPVLEFFSFSLS